MNWQSEPAQGVFFSLGHFVILANGSTGHPIAKSVRMADAVR